MTTPSSWRAGRRGARALTAAAICLGLMSGVVPAAAAALSAAPPTAAPDAGATGTALVYEPAPGTANPALEQAPPLDGAHPRGRIMVGVRGAGPGPVRYELQQPGGGTPSSVTAPDAATHLSLDISKLSRGAWRLTASAAGVTALATFTVPGAPSSSTQTPPTAAGGMLPITASSATGDRVLRGGQPWWFLGYNSFVWSGDCGTDQEKMTAQQVDAWFASMRHDGHGAVRLFFFDGWSTQRLDQALDSARRNNVYVTITLDDAIGGCGTTKKDAAWFASAAATGAYQRHMTDVLQRYKGNPTVAWLEFFNEPTDAGGALRRFYDRMGDVANGIDPGRLFSAGTVAPYGTGGDDGYKTINESRGVDIASMHEYDENEVESNHGPGARANAAGKPVIVGEAGIRAGNGCSTSDATRAQRMRAKAAAYTGAGYAGMLAWAWQPGSGGCEYGTLDTDTATQDVLRTAGPAPRP